MAASRRPLGLTRLEDRCTPAGLDPTFGTGGVATIDLGGYDLAAGAITQPDGKVVALASTSNGSGDPQAVLVRLNADGTRDTTFDGDGVLAVPGQVYGGSLGYGPYGVGFGRLADGDYLVVASATTYTAEPGPTPTAPPIQARSRTTLTLARYNADGTTDSTRTLDLGENTPAPTSLLVQADGSVLTATNQPPPNFAVIAIYPPPQFVSVRRITPDGQFDTAYGTDGYLVVGVGQGQSSDARLQAGPDGSVYVTGTTYRYDYPIPVDGTSVPTVPAPPRPVATAPDLIAPGQSTLFAARLNADGTRDTGYGESGLFTFQLPQYGTAFTGLTVANDGALLIGFNGYNIYLATAAPGGSGAAYPTGPTVRRVTPAGDLDTAYAGDGTLDLTSPHLQAGYVGPHEYVSIYSVSLTPTADGGAFVLVDRTDGLFVQKLTAAGGIDTRYGDGGLLFLANPTGVTRNETAAVVAADGDLVLVGSDAPAYTPLVPPVPPPAPGTPLPILPPSGPVPSDLFAERIAAAAPTPPLPPVPVPNDPAVPPPPPPGWDFTGDGVADTLQVLGNALQLLDGAANYRAIFSDFTPYEASYTGGLVTAFADLDGDGKAEIVVAPDVTGSARVQVLSVQNGGLVVRDNFFAIDDANFRGGANIATGDVNGDGTPDLIVTAGPGGGPRTAIYDGRGLASQSVAPPRLVPDFFAFPGEDAARLRDGATVAAADLNGDGKADLVFGSGPGGAPRVFVLAGDLIAAGNVAQAQASPLANFYSGGDANSRGGSRVSLTDVNQDGRPDLTVTNGATGAIWEYSGPGIPGAPGEPVGRRVDVVAFPDNPIPID